MGGELNYTEYTIQVLTQDGTHNYPGATLCVDVVKSAAKQASTCDPSFANSIITFLQPMKYTTEADVNFVNGVVKLLQGIDCKKIAAANGQTVGMFTGMFTKEDPYRKLVAQAIVDARLKHLAPTGGKPRRKATHKAAKNKRTPAANKWVATARKAKVPSRNKKTGLRCLVEKTVYRNTATGELRVRKMAVSRTTGALRATYVAF
jgi:hypothetical protein